METTKIALFKGKKIRKTLFENEWWFVVEDVVLALTDSVNIKDYINKMRDRDAELSKGYGQIVHTLEGVVRDRLQGHAGILPCQLKKNLKNILITRT